jgi:hypothetical protein
MEEETVEGVRNAEGGTKRAWEACDMWLAKASFVQWTPTVKAAMGE